MAELSDYVGLLRSLFPRGLCWDGPRHTALISGMAGEFQRADARIDASSTEYFPDTTTELLGEWARILGLGEEAIDMPYSRSLILGRFAASSGQSKSDYLRLIATVAPESKVKIRDFARMRAGFRAGESAYGAAWDHTWEISDIRREDISALKLIVESLAQAHTHVRYRLEGGEYV